MLTNQKDQLLLLVQSLSKAEKRNFKLYSKRFQSSEEAKFIKLFDILDKMQEYDEDFILKKLKDAEKKQLPNLKRHLYNQILISLRLISTDHNIDMHIREQIDFARILYGKGLYMQSLKILDRTSKFAYDNHQDLLHLEILEFQKLIEARHITRSRSVKNKMESLLLESSRRSRITHTTSKLSNLNIQIQGWYIQFGHIHNEREASVFKEYFAANISNEYAEINLTFFEKINLFQAYLWYNYVMLDFEKCLFHTRRWVDLFEVETQMKEQDPDLFIRGLYYQLTFCFFNRDLGLFENTLARFQRFLETASDKLNDNSKNIIFIYLNISLLNQIFLSGQFHKAAKLIDNIEKELPQHEANMDFHRIFLFYFKFAALNFCMGHYSKALDYINEIIHHKADLLKEELHINAKLLQLLCYFQMEEFDFMVTHLIPSFNRAFGKSKSIGKMQKAAVVFLKSMAQTPKKEHLEHFQTFKVELEKILIQPIEKKDAHYLDIPLWVESVIAGLPIHKLKLVSR